MSHLRKAENFPDGKMIETNIMTHSKQIALELPIQSQQIILRIGSKMECFSLTKVHKDFCLRILIFYNLRFKLLKEILYMSKVELLQNIKMVTVMEQILLAL